MDLRTHTNNYYVLTVIDFKEPTTGNKNKFVSGGLDVQGQSESR